VTLFRTVKRMRKFAGRKKGKREKSSADASKALEAKDGEVGTEKGEKRKEEEKSRFLRLSDAPPKCKRADDSPPLGKKKEKTTFRSILSLSPLLSFRDKRMMKAEQLKRE